MPITVVEVSRNYAFGYYGEEKIFLHFNSAREVEGAIGIPSFSRKRLKYTPRSEEKIMAIIGPGTPHRQALSWAPLALWEAVSNGQSEEVQPMNKSASSTVGSGGGTPPPSIEVKFDSRDKRDYRVMEAGRHGPDIVQMGKIGQLLERVMAGSMNMEGKWLEQKGSQGWVRVSNDPIGEALEPAQKI